MGKIKPYVASAPSSQCWYPLWPNTQTLPLSLTGCLPLSLLFLTPIFSVLGTLAEQDIPSAGPQFLMKPHPVSSLLVRIHAPLRSLCSDAPPPINMLFCKLERGTYSLCWQGPASIGTNRLDFNSNLNLCAEQQLEHQKPWLRSAFPQGCLKWSS